MRSTVIFILRPKHTPPAGTTDLHQSTPEGGCLPARMSQHFQGTGIAPGSLARLSELEVEVDEQKLFPLSPRSRPPAGQANLPLSSSRFLHMPAVTASPSLSLSIGMVFFSMMTPAGSLACKFFQFRAGLS